jgi:DNA-directed RNA polymerase subunit H (RpoH/RPB5)
MSTIDLIVRSRPVILEILEARGYDVSVYKDVSPVDMYMLASKKTSVLTITAKKFPDSTATKDRVVVLYWTENKLYRQSAGTILDKIYAKVDTTPGEGEDTEAAAIGAAESEDDVNIDPRHDEIVILISEPFHEQYNQLALSAWGKKIRVSFFALKNLISNPAKHFMVPPHRKLSPEEMEEVLKSLHMRSVNEFPHIKFHFDMQSRVLGLVPGDVVEIQRPSETAGIYTFYRVCLP